MFDYSSASSHTTIAVALRELGSVFAEEEAQLLLLASDSPAERSLMVKQRMSGVPLQLILGWAKFYGLRIRVESGIFIPRLRSEFLVDQAQLMASIFTLNGLEAKIISSDDYDATVVTGRKR